MPRRKKSFGIPLPKDFLIYFFSCMWYTERMKYDYTRIYNKNAAFYNAHPRAKVLLCNANLFLTALFPLAYLLLWGYELFFGTANAKELLWLFFLPALALLIVSVLRIAIRRPRPYTAQGANITPLLEKSSRDDESFPSRHATSATVIGTVFLHFFPVVGALLLFASLALAYTRFALGLHYPSDLLVGLVLGAGLGCCIFFL